MGLFGQRPRRTRDTRAWRPARFAAAAFVGMLLAQTAWLLAMPAFQAIDEFDHVYRAAGVADGQWRLSEEPEDGRGLVVVVPEPIVDAASAMCVNLEYPGPDNCFAIRSVGEDRVAIATAAARYHPFYYWVIGEASSPFQGDAADMVMRVVSAVVAAGGVAVAAFCLALMKGGVWTRLGFVVSLTPVFLYTSIVPAPNAWEIVAGLCLWTALLSLTQADVSRRCGRGLLLTATLSAVLLVTLRTLGPLWLALIVIVVAAFVGPAAVGQAVRRQPLGWVMGTIVVLAATASSAWWIRSMEQTASHDTSSGEGLADLVAEPLVWTLGTVGAFPWPNQPAPMPIYVLYFIVVVTVIVVALRAAGRRERWAIIGAVGLTYLVPAVLTLLTLSALGAIWQGRYGLPFAIGVLILCGVVMDRAGWAPVERRRLTVLGLCLVGVAHAWSVWEVIQFQHGRMEVVPSASWVAPHPALGGLLIAGSLAVAMAAVLSGPSAASSGRAGHRGPAGRPKDMAGHGETEGLVEQMRRR